MPDLAAPQRPRFVVVTGNEPGLHMVVDLGAYGVAGEIIATCDTPHSAREVARALNESPPASRLTPVVDYGEEPF